jgi:hypothetical protein
MHRRTTAALSTQLYGDGTPNAKDLLDAWALSYSYVRDDVRFSPLAKIHHDGWESPLLIDVNPSSISYAGSGTEVALTAYIKQTVVRYLSLRSAMKNVFVDHSLFLTLSIIPENDLWRLFLFGKFF